MEKIVVEVGSCSTKIDLCNGEKVEHLETYVIQFKKNYKKQNKLDEKDVITLINKIKEYKRKYSNIYVCGTSVFRSLTEEQRQEFIYRFYKETDINFEIINQEKENELTVQLEE